MTTAASDHLPVSNRDQLIYLLTEASEIEHCLMCCYLYAAFSLKQSADEDLSEDELAEVLSWRETITGVAIDEMLHLALVSNLLVAIGSRPHIQRQNFPVAPGVFPGGVIAALAPFDAETLDHFIYLERPEAAVQTDAKGFLHGEYERGFDRRQLMAGAQDYATVGALYATIAESIRALAAESGEAQLFIGHDAPQLDEAATGLWGLRAIRNVEEALAAITTIVEQGEGSPGAAENSHFTRFGAIRERMQALQTARPGFAPARNAARNPVMRRPPTPEGKIFIDDPDAARLVDLCNAVYGLMLRCLAASYSNTGAACSGALARTSIALMRVMAPLAQRLTTMPASTAAPGVNAGMSFAISRFPLDYANPQATIAAIVERLREIAPRIAEFPQFAETLGARLTATLHRCAEDLAAQPLAVSAAVVATATPEALPHPTTVTTQPAAIANSNGDTAHDSNIEVAHGRDVTLRFEARRCIHSRQCVLGQPDVFKANTPGEWIFPDSASAEALATVAQACPSGAITYERRDGQPGEPTPEVNVVRVRENGPLAFSADLDIRGQAPRLRATLCRCGASKQKPFCDGSHVEADLAASGEAATRESQPLAVRDGALVVAPQENGPLQVEGNLEICCGTGRTIDRVAKTWLCRCGHSANKPFCDGSHRKAGFVAPAVE